MQSYFNPTDDQVLLEPKPNQELFLSKPNQTTTVSQHSNSRNMLHVNCLLTDLTLKV